jgi:hypothetical protein
MFPFHIDLAAIRTTFYSFFRAHGAILAVEKKLVNSSSRAYQSNHRGLYYGHNNIAIVVDLGFRRKSIF